MSRVSLVTRTPADFSSLTKPMALSTKICMLQEVSDPWPCLPRPAYNMCCVGCFFLLAYKPHTPVYQHLHAEEHSDTAGCVMCFFQVAYEPYSPVRLYMPIAYNANIHMLRNSQTRLVAKTAVFSRCNSPTALSTRTCTLKTR